MRTKILLFSITFSLAALAASSQINTGRYFLGGSFNIYNEKNTEPSPNSKYTSLNTNIQFGKVVKANNVAGIVLSYEHFNFSPKPNPHQNESKDYRAGIFYRKYKSLGNKFYFFGELSASYFHWVQTQNFYLPGTQGYKTTSNGGAISFVPGISYSVCKRMQVELLIPNSLSVSYAREKTDYNSDPASPPSSQKGSVFSFNTNLNFSLLSSFGIGFKFFPGK